MNRKCWVFLLMAFASVGHECRDLLSPYDGMHVFTEKSSVYFLIQRAGSKIRSYVNSKEKSLQPDCSRES